MDDLANNGKGMFHEIMAENWEDATAKIQKDQRITEGQIKRTLDTKRFKVSREKNTYYS